jgi:hypothetical protein
VGVGLVRIKQTHQNKKLEPPFPIQSERKRLKSDR